LAQSWLADWKPPQNGQEEVQADPPPRHALPDPTNTEQTPADPMPIKLTQAEILKLARMRAMLRLIRLDEHGPISDYKAYHNRYGGRDPMSDRDMMNNIPKIEYSKGKHGELIPYTAAGAYAITRKTLQDVQRKLRLTDFTPANQARIALDIINEESAADDIEQGNLRKAIRKLKGRWTSLPGGSQTHTTIESATKQFDAFVAEE
jgi:muramidase (phage lysozyme)